MIFNVYIRLTTQTKADTCQQQEETEGEMFKTMCKTLWFHPQKSRCLTNKGVVVVDNPSSIP